LRSEVAQISAPAPIAGSTWRAVWPFWLSATVFLGATLVDSGRSWNRILGQSPGSLATFLVIFAGLLNLRSRAVGFAGVATLGILLVIAGQVMFRGEPLSAAYRLVGPLTMVWVLAFQRADLKFVINVLRLVFVVSAFLAAAYYLGFWREEEGAMSFPNMNRNIVSLMLVVGAALALYLGRQGHLGSYMRWGWPLAMIVFALPMVMTMSRKGVIAFALVPLLYFGLTLGHIRFGRIVLALGLLAGVASTLSTESITESSEPAERLVHRFESGDPVRESLFELAVDLIRREPLTGYGISATYSESWRVAHGFMNPVTGNALSVHNGFLALALMGGLPLLILYVMFLASTAFPLARQASDAAGANERELCALGFVLLAIIAVAFLTAGGSEYWKFGWFLVGAAMLIADVVARNSATAPAELAPAPPATGAGLDGLGTGARSVASARALAALRRSGAQR
jgi:O-antigen ligase